MPAHTFTDDHGVEVFYRSWPCDGAKGVVVIAHGASEHSGRYDRFALALNDAGYAAYAIDHRGHGETGRAAVPGQTGPGGFAAIIDDLRDLVERARAEVPAVPVVLFGHSMGSVIVQAYVERYGDGLAGYVLSGCPGPMQGFEEIGAALQAAIDGGAGDEPADLLGGLNAAFEPGRTRFDWLSRDDAEVDEYIADPFCGDNNPLSYRFFAEMFALAPAFEAEKVAMTPPIPVLTITGDQDPAAGMGANARELEKRLRDAGLDVTARYYPDARHELLNETNRDEVTADVVAWLDRVVAG